MRISSCKTEKILITGATGYLGGFVVEKCLELGLEVIASGRNKSKAEQQRWFEKVEYRDFPENILLPESFEYFGKPDRLIHLAWQGLPNYQESFHLVRNFPENYHFLESMVAQGLKALSCVGTCFEYGLQEGSLREDTPLEPTTTYGLAKASLFRALELLRTKHPFHFTWPRLFYIKSIHPTRGSLLGDLEKAIQRGEKEFNLSGGEQMRDFLTPEEAASQITSVALQDKIEGAVNCGSGRSVSIRSLVETHLNSLPGKIDLNFGYYPYPKHEPMRFWADISKLQSAILEFYRIFPIEE